MKAPEHTNSYVDKHTKTDVDFVSRARVGATLPNEFDERLGMRLARARRGHTVRPSNEVTWNLAASGMLNERTAQLSK